MLTIDGSEGEGGGQILRTGLGLSVVTGVPVRFERIRAGRAKPGLMRQHLTAVLAAARVGNAFVEGAALGSQTVTFSPQGINPGHHQFDIGTAGSAALVLQTVLPALLRAEAPSWLVIEGGTHNPKAPPFEFLQRAFAPLLARMGAKLDLRLERPGFYPAGGGRLVAEIVPGPLKPLVLDARGGILRRRARAITSQLPPHIARRELAVIAEALRFKPHELMAERVEAHGPGNAVLIEVEAEHITEVFTAIGARGKPAERVAGEAAAEAREWLDGDVPVGPHLADQLILPLALAGGGRFVTGPLTLHSRTQIETVKRFLPVAIAADEDAAGRVTVRVGQGTG